MKKDAYQKLFKAGIATALVASAVVVAPTNEVNAQKESGKNNGKNNGKNHGKNNGKGKKPTPKVDKTKLQTAISNVSKLKKGDYTEKSWNKFQQALSAAQKVVKNSKATQADVTKALNYLNATIASLIVLKQPTEAKVNTFKELKAAIDNPKIKNITIQKDIKVEETLKITSEKHINGNGFTLTGVNSGKGYNVYLLQFFRMTGSLSNIKIKDADAAIYVDGSTVTISGDIDVSGNKVAGIIISGTYGTKTQSLVKIVKARLVNRDETNYTPTILEHWIENIYVPNKVTGYEGMYVDFNQKSANHLQRVYYLNRSLSAPNPVNIKNFTLSLMHTNDTHGNLEQIAKKVTAVKEVRAVKPKALLVDAGDVFSGNAYFKEFKGLADLRFMNLMGYDIMTFGDHEFDLGLSREGHQALVDFINGANFSFVSSNIDFSRDAKFKGLFSDSITSNPHNGKIYNGIIKEIDGEKVGFFGLTTEETRNISHPGSIAFKNYIEEAKQAVQAFEAMGVNKIVAITHIGYDDNPAIDNDVNLATMVEGIDVIVGGHSHTQLNQPVVFDGDGTPTIIVQAGHSNEYLGILDVEFDKKGVIVRHAGKLIKIADKVADKETTSLLKPYKSKVE